MHEMNSSLMLGLGRAVSSPGLLHACTHLMHHLYKKLKKYSIVFFHKGIKQEITAQKHKHC